MAVEKPTQTGELELKKLEAGIDELIRSCDLLKEENRAVRKQLASLMGERAILIEKNAQAHTRVEMIIQRLKVLEQEA